MVFLFRSIKYTGNVFNGKQIVAWKQHFDFRKRINKVIKRK